MILMLAIVLLVFPVHVLAYDWDPKVIDTEIATAIVEFDALLNQSEVKREELKAELAKDIADPNRADMSLQYQALIDKLELAWVKRRQLECIRCILNERTQVKIDECVNKWKTVDILFLGSLNKWSILTLR